MTSSFIVCIILGYINQRQQQEERTRVQHAVLGVAIFDHTGKLLVGKTGSIPCQTITQNFNRGALDDDFNTSHPIFQWIFRITRNWTGISDLIPSMREHLQLTGHRRNSRHGADDSMCSTTFRELFCVTAEEIATSLEMSIDKLGYLYEDVLATGTVVNDRTTWNSTYAGTVTPGANVSISDLELGRANSVVFGKGQMLLLTRKVDNTEAHRLQQLGHFSFADVGQVSYSIARSLQVPCTELEHLLARLHAYSERQYHVPKKGTYLASFLIQPRPGMREVDVVVPRTNPVRLPMIKLDDHQLDIRQLEILSTFDGLTLDECLARTKGSSETDVEDAGFMQKLRNGIERLLRECPEETLRRAVFSAQQLDMVYGQTQVSEAKVFAFCGIKEIYVQSLQSLTLKTIPFSFFKTYLRSQPGCADHAVLVQRNHDEFGSLQQSQSDAEIPSGLSSKWPWNLRTKRSVSSETSWDAETSSMNELVNYRLTRSLTVASAHLWGNLVMSSIRNVNSAEYKPGSKLEMHTIVGKGDTAMVDLECQTLADKLMLITTSFRDPLLNQLAHRSGVRN